MLQALANVAAGKKPEIPKVVHTDIMHPSLEQLAKDLKELEAI